VAILTAQQEAQRRQIVSLERQLEVLDKEVERFQNLVGADAAPQKQLDDLTGQRAVLAEKLNASRQQIDVIAEQIAAARYQVGVQNRSILSETTPTEKRLALVEKQISDGTIVNDYPGTIINQYAYDGEFATMGKPLYQIADLSELILRVYVSGDQLGQVHLQDSVIVRTDDGTGGYRETEGLIIWISPKAEFTPKTIQTKEERANRVYAVKIKVRNDGSYKIGMYAQIKFRQDEV
jgi:HlyD family secretion protein